MKKEVSLKTINIIGSIGAGFFWLISGIFQNFAVTEKMQIVTIITMAITFLLMFIPLLLKREKNDEMSRLHMMKADSDTFGLLTMLFLIFGIVGSSFKLAKGSDISINWRAWLNIIIGAMKIVSGILFAKYERDGE